MFLAITPSLAIPILGVVLAFVLGVDSIVVSFALSASFVSRRNTFLCVHGVLGGEAFLPSFAGVAFFAVRLLLPLLGDLRGEAVMLRKLLSKDQA